MSAAYDATFTTGGSGINDVLQLPTVNAGLEASQPAGHWTVSGNTLVSRTAGAAPGFLTRPSAEPSRVFWYSYSWGRSQTIVALTPPGGWGSSATAWGLALCWSMTVSDPGQTVYYLAEARPGTVSARPNTLTISKVEAGTSTALGSVAWTNNATKDGL
jgi:hypothetical protein